MFELQRILLRHLMDMPADKREGLVVCRRCVAIRKRSGLLDQEKPQQGHYMSTYNAWDSLCDGCMIEYERLSEERPLMPTSGRLVSGRRPVPSLMFSSWPDP